MTARHRFVAGLALVTAISLSACSDSGSQEADQSPAEVLAEAKRNLDDTSGVHVVLATEQLPKGVNGVVSADGIGTHAPAFEGDLQVASGGITADAAVVAVDNVVYAKLPFTTSFAEIDPADYGAPDPAELMSTDAGLSSLLTEAADVEEGEPERSGETVVTTFTGTVPGDVVASIIPSASAADTFDATFTITEEGLLNEAALVGPFYPDAEDVTYTIEFDEYDTDREITAP
jgi:lipoprotein LprG